MNDKGEEMNGYFLNYDNVKELVKVLEKVELEGGSGK